MENNQKKEFFTRKKIITYVLSTIIFVVFIFLLYKFIFEIDFQGIGEKVSNSFNSNNSFWLWFILLILFPAYNCFFRILTYKYKLRKYGIYVDWYNWIIFCLITFFIGAITPFAMGSEPYIIYWLKKRGLSVKEATAIVASITVINPFIQILITWPSFFIVSASYSTNINKPEWIGSYWAVFVGLIFDLIASIFWFVISYSKKTHYLIVLFFNNVKRIVRLKYKTKYEIKKEFVDNESFKKLFMSEIKNKFFLILVSLGSLTWNILYYCSLIFAFMFVDNNANINAFELFNYVNIATTANNFIPIPGAEGTTQAILIMFINNSSSSEWKTSGMTIEELANYSVFIWRLFTFYSTAILGLISFLIMITQELRIHVLNKKKKKINISQKKFNIMLFYKKGNDITKTIKYIHRNSYNKNLIKLYIICDKNSDVSKIKKQIRLSANKNFVSWEIILNQKKNFIEILNTNLQSYYMFIDSNAIIQPNYFEYLNNNKNNKNVYIGAYKYIKSSHFSIRTFQKFLTLKKNKSTKEMNIDKINPSTIVIKSNAIKQSFYQEEKIPSIPSIVYKILSEGLQVKITNKICCFIIK